jgi:hypothetical protein
LNDYIRNGRSGHSTPFQEGSDNSKVEKKGGGEVLQNHQQNKAAHYFHFDIFILEKKAAGGNM